MKYPILILVIFHSIFSFLPDTSPEYRIYKSPLCIGDQLQFGKRSVLFKEVVADSRCPKGATCIRAGEAKVLVEFYLNGEMLGEKVITGEEVRTIEVFKNRNIELSGFQLEPYPDITKKIFPEEYTLTISISERIK